VIRLQILLIGLAGIVSMLFGVRYLATKQFMPYHAAVAGKAWSELGTGMQAVILGMLRIVGGGLLTYGLAMLWLLLPISAGQRWAAWAVLTLTAATVLPTLYVTITLKRTAPGAPTPVAAAAAVLAIATLGAVLSFL
jgi:hypothetical protein